MDKAAPALRKISTDSKIGPLLEQFERACSNNKAAPLHMPGTSYYTDATKPQASSIPKSQSTDILSPEKTSVPKSQSIDLLSPTGSAIPKSQSTDLLKPQFPTSQSSIALKADQKTVIPKSQSSAALKSRKSSLPKQQNSSATKKESSSPKKESKKESASLKKESTSPKKESKKESTSPKKESKKEQKKESSPSKQDSSSTSKSHGRTWKPKNSKLQALFHKAERRKRKKTKEEKVAEAHHDQKDDHAKEEVHPTKAKHAKEEDHPTKAKHAKEEDYPTKAKHAEREFHPTKTKCAEEDSCPIEAIYALVQKINMDDSLTPQTAAALLVGSQTPGCWVPPEEIPPTSKDPNRDDELDNQSGHRKISLDRARFTVGSEYSSEDVYASLKKVRRTAKEEEIHPPLPPRLYENVFDDPIIAEQDNDMGRGAHHNPKAQSLQGIASANTINSGYRYIDLQLKR